MELYRGRSNTKKIPSEQLILSTPLTLQCCMYLLENDLDQLLFKQKDHSKIFTTNFPFYVLESKICINIRIAGNICIKYQGSTFEKDNTFWYPVTDVNKPSKPCVVSSGQTNTKKYIISYSLQNPGKNCIIARGGGVSGYFKCTH